MTTTSSQAQSQAAPKKVKLKIDGVEVEAKAGQTIIEAAREAGIYIPYLCYHPVLKPYGACRMCVVEVSNIRGTPAACHTTVSEGMEVKTNTVPIEEIRRDVLALTLVNHPHGCLTCWRIEHCGPRDVCLRNVSVTDRCVVCPQNERCELQDVTYYIKLNEVPLPYEYRQIPLETRNPFIDHDMNLCIVCGKCVRACDEIEGAYAITFESRGNRTVVKTSLGGTLADSGCTFCGLCVDVCPVGAITEKDSKWAGRADAFVQSACSQCSVGCSLQLNVKKEKLIRVTHDVAGEANHGHECVQGKFGYKWVNSKERILKPRIKQGGQQREASWDEAIELVAAKLKSYKPGEVAFFASPKATNEDNYILQKFARAAVGTNNIDSFDQFSPPTTLKGLEQAFGSSAATNTFWELRDSRLIFVVDSDLTSEHPVAGLQVKEAVRRGAHLVVLDPRDTELGLNATEKLVCNPGTEVHVLGAIMNTILAEKLEDKQFISARTTSLDELQATLAAFQPAEVARLSGVAVERITQIARLLAAHKPGAFIFSTALSHGNDVLGRAVANLAMLTGNVGRAGAGVYPMRGENNSQGALDMGCAPDKLPGGLPVGSVAAGLRISELWGTAVPKEPGLDGNQIFGGMAAGRIKAVVYVGENGLVLDPSGFVTQAFAKLEFLVAIQSLSNVVTPLAHVVLPTTSFAEKDGTNTSFERRVQRVRQAVKPQGESRNAWQVLTAIAQRMGTRGFDYEGPAAIFDELAQVAPSYAGLSHKRLEQKSVQVPCPTPEHEGTPILHAVQFSGGIGRFLPLHAPAIAQAQGLTALASVAREVKGQAETGFEGRVEIASADARGLGIADGERVMVESNLGNVLARAHVNGRAPQGTVLLTLPQYNVITDAYNKAAPGPLTPFTKAKRFGVRLSKA